MSERAGQTTTRRPIAVAVDSIAEASLRRSEADGEPLACDACDAPIEGEPGGRGLFMWTRGDETRFEEPPLCAACATAIGVTALRSWSAEEEEEG